MDLYFVTSNKGKFETLKRNLELNGAKNVNLIMKPLNIVEPQADSAYEISKYKAEQAYNILKSPVVVEDGGMEIEVLNKFPGVYTRYVLETIGIKGFLKLLDGEENRTLKFASITTFVDEKGTVHQFERGLIEYDFAHEAKNIDSPFAWSELWKVIYVREFGKTLCEFSEEDLRKYYDMIDKIGSLQKFAAWFSKNY
ncbi:MAG: hypothetical protein LBR70_02465 [Lactobacillaceae bacterium]|jgi:XTP/dITP diphosphohydrolase|nr:hypothetical protein [Lactobacillaceae bacterium]